jgi:prepilin-type N-terminal cleavage/methylation domain-containing protein
MWGGVHKMRKHKQGFTLIELIITMVLIGILVAIGVPIMSGFNEKAMKTEAITAIGTIRTAQRAYFDENDEFAVVQDFSDPNNPLSSYMPPGSLEGAFFSENCYKTAPVNATTLNSALSFNDRASYPDILENYLTSWMMGCKPIDSKNSKVRKLKNIYMRESDGKIIEIDGTLIY